MLKHLAACLVGCRSCWRRLHQAAAEKRVALVIGNSAYQHVPRLANPSNDATDMAAKLRASRFRRDRGASTLPSARWREHQVVRRQARRRRCRSVLLCRPRLAGRRQELPRACRRRAQVRIRSRFRGRRARPRPQANGAQRPHQHRLPRRLPRQSACRQSRRIEPLARRRPRASPASRPSASMMVVYLDRARERRARRRRPQQPIHRCAAPPYRSAEGESISDMMIDVRNEVLKATGRQAAAVGELLAHRPVLLQARRASHRRHLLRHRRRARLAARGDRTAAGRSGRAAQIAARAIGAAAKQARRGDQGGGASRA